MQVYLQQKVLAAFPHRAKGKREKSATGYYISSTSKHPRPIRLVTAFLHEANRACENADINLNQCFLSLCFF